MALEGQVKVCGHSEEFLAYNDCFDLALWDENIAFLLEPIPLGQLEAEIGVKCDRFYVNFDFLL